MTEDEMVGWHHPLNEHEFEQALGGGEGKESMVCCRPWVCKASGLALSWVCASRSVVSSSLQPQGL